MALKRVWIPSPNYSSRGGASVRLIVLHTAEGARTIESLGSFFGSSSAGVSSQVGADDKVNTVGEYVSRANKAWTQGNFNPIATSMELCGFASWTRDEWLNNHGNMLANCAAWIAEEAAHFGVPITKLTPAQAQGSGRGVCQHIDLGAAGGGHVDCGSGFPYDHVLDLARSGGAPPTQPPPEVLAQEDPNMIAIGQMKDGRFEVFVEAHVDKAGQCGEVFHGWNDRDGGWAGQKAGSTAAHWESLGTPGKD
jgi:hypothetical protein